MDLVITARDHAERALAEALPRRWVHVQAVAAKADHISEILPEADRPVLIAAAWLHDIGYSPSVVSTGLHALDGARWLRQNGFDDRIASLVAHHSCALFEAAERGLGNELRSEFALEESPVRDALWYADMTTGPDGHDLGVAGRLAEIRSRYGPDHIVTRFWARAEPSIVAAVQRTERRLAVRAAQPM